MSTPDPATNRTETFTVPVPPGGAYTWRHGDSEVRRASPEQMQRGADPEDPHLHRRAIRAFDTALAKTTGNGTPQGGTVVALNAAGYRCVTNVRLSAFDRNPAEPLDVRLAVTTRRGEGMPTIHTLESATLDVIERALRCIQAYPQVDARLVLEYRDPHPGGSPRTTYTEVRHQNGLTTLAFARMSSKGKPVEVHDLAAFPSDVADPATEDSRRTFLRLTDLIGRRQQAGPEAHRLDDQLTLRTLLGEIAGRVTERTESSGLKHATVHLYPGPGFDQIVLESNGTVRREPDLDPTVPKVPQLIAQPDDTVPDDRLDWRVSNVPDLPGVLLTDQADPEHAAVIHAEAAMVLFQVIRIWVQTGNQGGGLLDVVTISSRRVVQASKHAAPLTRIEAQHAAPLTRIEAQHASAGTVQIVSYGTCPTDGQRRFYTLTLQAARLSSFLRTCHAAERAYLQTVIATPGT